MPEPLWRRGALCAQVDPDLFYPDKGMPAEPAKRICRNCDVRQQCLDYALANLERHGVWGGTSPAERLLILRQSRPGFCWPKEPLAAQDKGQGGPWGRRTHCSRGHELTPQNVYVNAANPAHRACRTCKRMSANRRKELRKELSGAL